jgi:hypothetical protein
LRGIKRKRLKREEQRTNYDNLFQEGRNPLFGFYDSIYLNELLPEIFNLRELYGIGRIALGNLWVQMRFHENAVNASGDRCARDGGSILPVAARAGAEPAGTLDGMRRIHHNGISEFSHNQQRPHIRYKIAIAE